MIPSNKKIINFTPTGTQPTRANSLAPLLPNEIIEEVHQAFELGITLVHIHARELIGLNNTYDKNIYELIINGIRKYCPRLSICVSLSGRIFPEFEKRSEVIELYPDMGSLTMSSLNFPLGASINEPDIILKLIDKMKQFGVIPEIECFDSGMLNYTNYLIKKRILSQPYYINMIFGNIYNVQSDITSIAAISNNIPKENTVVCFGGIGKDQLRSNIMGLLYADGVRIGLEDNLYFRNKELATNIELLTRTHDIIKLLNYEILSPVEFQNLGFKNQIKCYT
jgi:uncharacterized protein (DUF849 family)